VFFVLLFIVGAALIFWAGYGYVSMTKPVPKKGGDYSEGLVGQPMYINPLLSGTSDADADLANLIYSGLLKFDHNGKLVGDLAESWEISDDNLVYTVQLRPNALWHDNEPITAEDVVFTVQALQNPDYKSPLRYDWQSTEVAQVDEHTVSFTLKKPYFDFLGNLTLGILPKHIWSEIAPEKFALANYNLEPVGSGPFIYISHQVDSAGNILSYNLKANDQYYLGSPYIRTFTFHFYPDEDTLLKAFGNKEIMAMGNLSSEKIESVKNKNNVAIYKINLPRYFAVYFNQNKSAVLADDNVREALNHATNRQAIIDQVLAGEGEAIFSPFVPGTEGFGADVDRHNFSLDEANRILEDDGWKRKDGGLREKNGISLSFDIYVTDWPELSQTADMLREQWAKIGADIKVNVLTYNDINQNFIRPREYDALIYGQEIKFNPDLYFFWHSSQKRDRGLNFSLFDNPKADTILEDARMEMDPAKRNEKYLDFQKILSEENPAVFLYSRNYLYVNSKKLKGAEFSKVNYPSLRFSEVNQWYLSTKRVRR
jgi:peptide/nickel transport system substrate-binding protein